MAFWERMNNFAKFNTFNNYLRILILVIILVIYFLVSFFKVSQFNPSRLNPKDDSGIFWTEAAFQYRYARMIAQGEKIPRVDYAAQYPEGVKPFEEFTLCMEISTGYLYRLAHYLYQLFFRKNLSPFHIFLPYCIAFYSSLTIFAVYLLSKEIWQSKLGGIISAVFYVTCRASWARTVIGFNYEDFALVFIFFGLYFFVRSCRNVRFVKTSSVFSVFSGMCLIIALASWHFTNFYLVVFTMSIIVLFYLYYSSQEIVDIMRSFLVVFSICLIGGITVPVLRVKGFLTSFSMVTSYSLIFAYILKRYFKFSGTKTLGIFSLIMITCIIVITRFFPQQVKEYSHVFSLFKYKVLFLGQKPLNSNLLPFDAKVLWVGGFDNLTARETIYFLSVTLIVGMFGILKSLRNLIKQKTSTSECMILCLAVSFLLLNLIVQRLMGFSAVLLAVFAGNWVENYTGKNLLGRYVAIGSLIFLFFVNSYFRDRISNLLPLKKDISFMRIYEPDKKSIVKWIKENTQPTDVFLTAFETAPLVLTDTGRAIVLHPKFESSIIRNKFREFVYSLYSSEEKFYNFCKKIGVNYFLYQVGFLFDSSREYYRYYANKPKVEKDSVVYKFHFYPRELRNFILVYQLRSFAVYKVIGEKVDSSLWNYIPPYYPIFGENLFLGIESTNYLDDKAVLIVFSKIITQDNLINEAVRYIEQNKYQEAKSSLIEAISLKIPSPDAYFLLGNIHMYMNEFDEAIKNYTLSIRYDKNKSKAYANLATAYIKKGLNDRALDYAKKAVELDPKNSDSITTLGIIYARQGKLSLAISIFEKAIQIDPSNVFAKEYYIKALRLRDRNK